MHKESSREVAPHLELQSEQKITTSMNKWKCLLPLHLITYWKYKEFHYQVLIWWFLLIPSVPALPGPGLAIHHGVSLSQGLSDLTISWGDPLHLGEVVRPKLDYSSKGKGILMNDAVWNSSKSKQILPDFWMNTTTDKILQHLPFTALNRFYMGCLI